MTRWETVKYVQEQINRLKEEHVADLMRAGRAEELCEILDDIDYSVLEEFFGECDCLMLSVKEIPQDSLLEAILLLQDFCSRCDEGIDDNGLFDDWTEITEALITEGGELEEEIATIMDTNNLCDVGLEELLGLNEQNEDGEE